MDKIIRKEFTGNRLFFFLLCLTGIGIPIAMLYLMEATITIETNVEDAEEFLDFVKKKQS